MRSPGEPGPGGSTPVRSNPGRSTPVRSTPGRSNPVRSCLLAALGLLVLAGGPAFCADTLSREYEIKAAFLYNFTKFVQWPPQSFADTSDPIVLGVLGHAAFAAELERIVEDRRVHGRTIEVRRLEAVEDARSTHVLFVSAKEDARFAAVEAAIDASPVLTVGESASFASAGGVIRFVLEGDKIRFEINVASAERSGLHISAQLQKLATLVRRGP